MSENENGDGPDPLPAKSAEGNGGTSSRRLSGFASKEYWTPERREAQKQLARKLYEEGRLGGRQPGAGRPKTKTVSEVVSEKAQDKGEQIARKLLDIALTNKAPSLNLSAIDRLIAYEQNYQKNMRDDEKEILKLSGKSLDDELARVLSEHGISYDYELSPDDVEEIEVGNGDS